MGHLSLSDSVLVAQDIAPQVASTNVSGTVFDMQGWDGCLFAFNIGAIVATGTFTATILTSPNANMSGNTVVNANVNGTLANATLGSINANSNSNVALLDVWRPSTRYLQSLAQPAVANVTFDSLAIRYRRTGVLPPTQVALQQVKVQAN